MKTDVILLQNFDDLDSVMDKLRQLTQAENCAPRVLLVWPRRGRILEGELEFAQVRNYLRSRGFQLAVVPNSESVKALAMEQDIPVFEKRVEAENADWKERVKGKPNLKPAQRARRLVELKESIARAEPQRPPRTAELFFFLLALGVCLALLYLLLPHAEVRISPERSTQRTEISLWTNDTLNAVTMNGGVPSQEELLTLELSATVPSSGTIKSSALLAENGESLEYPAPSSADYQIALTEIAAQISEAALEQVRERYGDLRMVLTDSVDVQNIVDEVITPEFGYASDSLTVRQTLNVSVRTILNSDVDQLVRSMLALQNEAEPLTNSVISDYEFLSQPQEQDGNVSWRVAVERSGYAVKTSEDAVRTLLRGKEIHKAQQVLEDIPHAGVPEISLFPEWIGRMPILGSNITVRIVMDES